MKAIELYRFLNEKIPTSLSCEWDHDGLMCCPEPEKEVRRVLLALDISEKTVEKAINEGFDVILSHHPLVFHPVRSLAPTEATPRKLIALVKNGISAMSFHTRLDALEGGVNDVLADLLGLRNRELFGKDGEMIGRIGDVEPTTLEKYASFVKETLNAPVVQFGGDKRVSRVALVGGGGDSFVSAAKAAGADTYVSGTIGYHALAAATEDGINLIEAGHFFTEHPVLSVLANFVKEADPSVETVIFSSDEIGVI